MPEQLEERLAYLEAEVAKLKSKSEKDSAPIPWWEKIAGTFADNPDYDEAMQLGCEYRESLRPNAAEPTESVNVYSGHGSPECYGSCSSRSVSIVN